jgi:hypothetical protein
MENETQNAWIYQIQFSFFWKCVDYEFFLWGIMIRNRYLLYLLFLYYFGVFLISPLENRYLQSLVTIIYFQVYCEFGLICFCPFYGNMRYIKNSGVIFL